MQGTRLDTTQFNLIILKIEYIETERKISSMHEDQLPENIIERTLVAIQQFQKRITRAMSPD